MILDLKNIALVYRCPECGTHVTSVVGVFALSGDLIVLKCPCGSSALEITQVDSERVKLRVPCVMCPDGHDYIIRKDTLFSLESTLVLTCKYSGIAVCAIGDKDDALEKMKESDVILKETLKNMGFDWESETLGKFSMANTMGDGGFFQSGSTLYDMANFMLSEFTAEGKIECRCGGSDDSYGFELLGDEEDSVRFFCKDCGAGAVYPAKELFYSDGSFRLEKIYLF